MNNIAHFITDRTATIYVNGEAYTVDRSTEAFQKVTELLNEADARDITDDLITVFETYELTEVTEIPELADRVTVTRRGVYFDGLPVHETLARRVLDIQQAGLPIQPWIKFINNIYANPADFSRDELYLWLEKSDLPITEDGHFLAYKKVRGDYRDIHTGTMDNSVGQTVVMPGGRQIVDPNRDNTCSVGLHFCSKSYLPSFGSWGSRGGAGYDRVVIVKVNPADVVSIPSDYDNAKGRTWQYEVVGELIEESPEDKDWAPVVGEDGTDVFRFDPEGFDRDGYDEDGFDRDGYDHNGYDRDGYDRSGYDEEGYDPDGYDEDGFDRDGYDDEGYDADGYDDDGYSRDG